MVRIGAHVSIEGGLDKAINRAQNIGADCIQIFGSSPRSWRPPSHSPGSIELFKVTRASIGIDPVFLHTIYLANLASSDHGLRAKSVESLAAYLRLGQLIGVAGVVTHLGSGTDGERAVCLALRRALIEVASDVAILLETSAGAGSSIGSNFESLGRIIAGLDFSPRVQVCLDTAHVFAAGYDVSSAEGLERTLSLFAERVGLDRLTLVHINDSKSAIGSRVDRHENIGQGRIGLEAFVRILHHPELKCLPFITEVPGLAGEGPGRKDVSLLKRLAGVEGMSDR